MPYLSFKRGDTWSLTATWKEGGSPVDLSGASARMQIRARGDGAVVIDVPVLHGTLDIDEPNGVVSISIPPSATEAITPDKYNMDIEYTFPDGSVRSTPTVEVRVAADVTHD